MWKTLFLFVFTFCYCEKLLYYKKIIKEQINSSINYKHSIDAFVHAPSDQNEPMIYGKFDFIIVGGGTTGSVIARRLSKVRNWKILVLEAGVFGNDITDIPAMMYCVERSDYNWGMKSVYQKTACLDMPNRKCDYPRGKGLGGSSLINGMVYARGNKLDFDNWAAKGNPGWSYAEVLPYFMKSEKFRKTDLGAVVDEIFHGTNGPLGVEYVTPRNPLMDTWLEANKEAGYEVVDYNGKTQSGAALVQWSISHGKRSDFGSAYLKSVKTRPNLTILERAYVTKIIIKNKRATGVTFTYKGKTFIAQNTKDVVLSAGAVQSPQILMLSGIGPKEHLRQLGIDVVVDLQVGSALTDHPIFSGLQFVTNVTKRHQSFETYIKEYLHGFGPLTGSHFGGGLGFYHTNNASIPNIELNIYPNDYFSDTLAKKLSQSKEKTWTHLNSSGSFTLFVSSLDTKSRGTIRLKSVNPFDYPLIDPQLLSDSPDHDIERLYEGVKIALNLLQTQAFVRINATLIKQKLPACEEEVYLSKNYWHCVLRYFTGTGYHAAGTCPMGPNPEKGDVVNARCKVYGVKSLRVADASVFPFPLSGHPNAVCGMIGEKVSNMIKLDYGFLNV